MPALGKEKEVGGEAGGEETGSSWVGSRLWRQVRLHVCRGDMVT